MERYDSYKDSGVEWIGEIPRHWAEAKLKNLGNVTLGKMLTNEDKGGFSLRPYLRSFNVQVERVDVSEIKEMWFSEKERSELRLLKGDLLFNEGGDVGRTSIWDDEIPECYIQNSVNRVRVKGNSRYFLYVSGLHHYTGYYDSQVNRVSIPHLTKEKLENTLFPSPPLHEQERIVEYLDRKTALIDSLIEKTVRKIELLREKRTALINHVVTKGLNPDVEMKDSGVEWIGEIPRHWASKKLSFSIETIVPMRDKPEDLNGDVPWIRIEDRDGRYISSSKSGQGVSIQTIMDMNLKVYPIGTVLTTCSCSFGTSMIVQSPLVSNQTFIGLVPNPEQMSSEFLYYQLGIWGEELDRLSSGSIQKYLSRDNFKSLKFLSPPLREQERIVEFLDEQTSIIDSTIATEEKRIELLKEYRQSLISEIVTGKLKVS
jgi:type I restriction enzyme S subunit